LINDTLTVKTADPSLKKLVSVPTFVSYSFYLFLNIALFTHYPTVPILEHLIVHIIALPHLSTCCPSPKATTP
jgi:hypothetical protein